MKKEEALQSILAKWKRRPESERKSEGQLVAFALEMANNSDYFFQCAGDRYQDIMAFMGRHTSGLKRLGP
jgi:hypothetical protein